MNHFPVQKEVIVPLGPEHEDVMQVILKYLFSALQYVILKAKETKKEATEGQRVAHGLCSHPSIPVYTDSHLPLASHTVALERVCIHF